MYTGQWKDDKQSGKGTESWPNGPQYTGEYLDSRKHGKGELHFDDGSLYKGSFAHSNIDGFSVRVVEQDAVQQDTRAWGFVLGGRTSV